VLHKIEASLRTALSKATVPHISAIYLTWVPRTLAKDSFAHRQSPFQAENITRRSYGNSLSAVCDVRGLIVDEISESELSYADESVAVAVCDKSCKYEVHRQIRRTMLRALL
jgi:hypothetical protein